jgi:hypothetical protein
MRKDTAPPRDRAPLLVNAARNLVQRDHAETQIASALSANPRRDRGVAPARRRNHIGVQKKHVPPDFG